MNPVGVKFRMVQLLSSTMEISIIHSVNQKKQRSSLRKSISFYAKCSDRFGCSIKEDGEAVGRYEGYPPAFLGDPHRDGINLEINIETGQILNWKKPSEEEISRLTKNTKD